MAVSLTYAELAARLGRSEAAAKSLAKRKSWRRTVGNDGLARIVVDDQEQLSDLANPNRRGIGRPPANSARAREVEPRPNPVHELLAKLAVAEALSIDRKAALDEANDRAVGLARELEGARVLAAAVEPLRGTVEALKVALDAERSRLAELRSDRDQWKAVATAPRRGWFSWRRRA